MDNCFWPQEYQYASCNDDSQSDHPCMVPWVTPNQPSPTEVAALQFHCYPSSAVPPPPPWGVAYEDRGGSSSRSHSEAEKRRRDRINGQLATLRKLIQNSEKMDKAALLGHVVEHVKDLTQKTKEISKISTIPTETDEVTIAQLNQEGSSMEKKNIYLKASVCCDDRPDLFAELNCALKGQRLTILEADITTLGGRMKAIFDLCAQNAMKEDDCFNTLKKSLYMVLNRVVMSSGSSNYRARSKRQRFFNIPPSSQY